MLHPKRVPRASPLGTAASCPQRTQALTASGKMWLTEPPGPSAVLCTQLPTGRRTPNLSHVLQNKTTPAVEAECEAQSRCRGSVCGRPACPAHPYLCLHRPRGAVLVTPSSHTGPGRQWAASGLWEECVTARGLGSPQPPPCPASRALPNALQLSPSWALACARSQAWDYLGERKNK